MQYRHLKFFLVFVFALFLLKQFCHRQTDGFVVTKILSSLNFNPAWEVTSLDEEEKSAVETLLDQPFYYLAKGAQSYVFTSEDGTAVIKFFRFDHLLPRAWFTRCVFPFPYERYRVKKLIEKQLGLMKDFQSYKIAFEEMREGTGLLYLHLNKSNLENRQIKIIDKLGITHLLDLGKIEFILQKKATLIYPSIAHLMQTEGERGAREAITNLIDLLHSRYEKGIFDKDPDLNTNFGFLGKKALQIDPGRFCRETRKLTPEKQRLELLRITDHFCQWLTPRSSALKEHLLNEIQRLYPFTEGEQEVAQALSLPYHYLGKGGQCDVYASNNDLYVLKFLKSRGKKRELEKLKKAFSFAFDYFAEETQILYTHFYPTEGLINPRFPDKIDLNTALFVLQRKVTPAGEVLKQLNEENFKVAVDKILSLHKSIYDRGFSNKDPQLYSNYGFDRERPVLIDVGRLESLAERPRGVKQEFVKVKKRFCKNLAKTNPELIPYVESAVNEILESYE